MFYLHNEPLAKTIVAVATRKRTARDEAIVGLASSVHSDESGTAREGAEYSLESDVVESRQEVGTAHAMILASGALEGIHDGMVAGLIRIVFLKVAISGGNTNERAIIVELEKVALAEAVNDGHHGELVGLEVEGLMNWVVRDLEREWVETTIRNNLNVFKATVGA